MTGREGGLGIEQCGAFCLKALFIYQRRTIYLLRRGILYKAEIEGSQLNSPKILVLRYPPSGTR